MNDESGCIFEIKKFGWLDVVLEKGGPVLECLCYLLLP
jgi:hypothetical protein